MVSLAKATMGGGASVKAATHMADASSIPVRIGDRHAFVHERVLVLVAMETRAGADVCLTKGALAQNLGVHVCSIDRAVKRLRAQGEIESIPRYNDQGAQLANGYRATEAGLHHADQLIARVFAVTA